MDRNRQDALYDAATAEFGAAIHRLARAYEADRDKQQDLLQDINIELWRSLGSYDGRCSLRTWLYRVAHNVGATHIARNRRASARLVGLEAIELADTAENWRAEADIHLSVGMLFDLVYRLKPLDRQAILMHLEGETAASIAETTGLSATNVATKVHRIKKLLQQHVQGANNAVE